MSKELDAAQLIATMSTTYREVDWYHDSGYVLTIYGQGSREEYTTRLDFKTHFCKPNLFRFEWSDSSIEQTSNQGSAVWSDGCQAYEKYGARESEVVQSDASAEPDVINDLELAIAGATGVSGGAVLTVSSLLLPIFNSDKVTDFSELRYVGDALLNGELCHCVRGSSHGHRQCKLWISSTRNILLKMRQQYEIDRDSSSWGYDNVTWLFEKQQNQSLGKENMRVTGNKALAVSKVTVRQGVTLNMQFPLEVFTR